MRTSQYIQFADANLQTFEYIKQDILDEQCLDPDSSDACLLSEIGVEKFPTLGGPSGALCRVVINP